MSPLIDLLEICSDISSISHGTSIIGMTRLMWKHGSAQEGDEFIKVSILWNLLTFYISVCQHERADDETAYPLSLTQYHCVFRNIFIHSFIYQSLYSAMLKPGLSFGLIIFFTQTVGLLGRVSSPSQGSYLQAEQYVHRINAHTDIFALSGIRNHDPSVRGSEDSACLRPCGHWTAQKCVGLWKSLFGQYSS
jgi:hypothetical protein